MRYTKPQIVATRPAVAAIQQIGNFGLKPLGVARDQSRNPCTPSGYDADE